MKDNFKNDTHVEGYVYEHHLEKRISGENSKHPGAEYIAGSLSIATDEEMTNVVQLYFRYVAPTFNSGRTNESYNILSSIIDGKIGSVMEHGKENAGKVRIDGTIGLNEWYDNRSPDRPLISNKRNEGRFIHQTSELAPVIRRATFDIDMLITGATRLEADEERGIPEKVVVRGYVFDYTKALLPVEFNVYAPYSAPTALGYFENLDVPALTRLQGIQVSRTVVKTIEEQSAFGEPIIKETRTSQRDFVITWAAPNTYDFGDKSVLTIDEFKEMLANREIYLADMKKRQDEYQASRSAIPTITKGAYDL